MKSCSIYFSHMPSFSFVFSKFWVCKLVITSKWNLKLVGSIVQNSESKLLGDMIWKFWAATWLSQVKFEIRRFYLWKIKNKVPRWKYKCLPKPYDDFTWENLLHICCLFFTLSFVKRCDPLWDAFHAYLIKFHEHPPKICFNFYTES